MKPRGFIALMSVVIISAILLVLLFTLGTSAFFNRFDALDAESKRVSLGLAEACVNSAMLQIAQGSTPSNQCLSLGGVCGGTGGLQKVCKICSVTGSDPAMVTARAVYNGAYSTIQATFDTTLGSFAITKWTELSGGYSTCIVP